MAIELIEQLKTTRTYPRLMRHKITGSVGLCLHDSTGGMVMLNGANSGLHIPAAAVKWEAFDDYIGSVTLHNRD